MEDIFDKSEIENYLFNSYKSDVEGVCNLLLKITFQSVDYKWIQDLCLRLIDLSDFNLSGLAVTCLGHIARIHGTIEKEKVFKKLNDNLNNEAIKDRIQDAIDDINMFT